MRTLKVSRWIVLGLDICRGKLSADTRRTVLAQLIVSGIEVHKRGRFVIRELGYRRRTSGLELTLNAGSWNAKSKYFVPNARSVNGAMCEKDLIDEEPEGLAGANLS